jgi:hypothetical protein
MFGKKPEFTENSVSFLNTTRNQKQPLGTSADLSLDKQVYCGMFTAANKITPRHILVSLLSRSAFQVRARFGDKKYPNLFH